MSEKVNRLRQEPVIPKREPLAEPEKKASAAPKANVGNIMAFFASDRLRKITGLLMLLFSIYLFVAFTSYVITWKTDQSVVANPDSGWKIIFDAENNHVENWLGIVGALVAHQFIHGGFGIASFIYVLLFFVLGYRILFRVHLLHLPKTFAYSLFLLSFLSVFFGIILSFFDTDWYFLAGSVGIQINAYLNAVIGKVGTAFILLFAGLACSVIAFNINFTLPERKPVVEEEESLTDEEAGFPIIPVPMGTEDAPVNKLKEDAVLPIAEEEEEALEPEFEPIIIQPDIAITEEVPVEEPAMETITFDAEELALTDAIPTEIITHEEPEAPEAVEEDEQKAAQLVKDFGEYDPTLDLSGYKPPHIELLENYGTGKIQINPQELEDNKKKIVATLGHYDIGIEKIMATIGPTVTLYEIVPKAGVRISKIKNLEDDIALSLAALGIRIIAPIPGKGTIGIEVPNLNPEMVSMRSILASEKFQSSKLDLPIALGKTISNEIYIADLAKMPHLLMAGATGQGKSVGINALLVSLLYKKHPSQLKFVLVDPKKVELTLFKKIERHFLAKLPGDGEAIITDTKKVINTLNSLCIEMDQRYDLLKDAQVRNLKEYNQKFVQRRLNPNEGHRFLPFIVLVIDEFADLMMTAGKEVETPIARLAQLARAIGIHLVVATQRPSVNIITGTIKANFPARLAFRVTSKIDSRTILDTGGADQLIGRGDMLLSTGSDLIRLQCAFVDTPEVEKITEYIGSQRGYASAHILPEYVGEDGEASSKEFDPNEKDALFEEAARLIVRHQQGSTSLIQRKMKLGYNRAGRIMDQLEGAGIVGPFEGSKAREVLFMDEHSLEEHLSKLNQKA